MKKAFENIEQAKEYAVNYLSYSNVDSIEIYEGKNGECDEKLYINNPEIFNVFNYVMSYGTVRNQDDRDKVFDNPCLNDLYHNYTSCFGTKEAIELYQKNGEITKGLINGIGRNHPVKISDAIKHREMFVGDGYTNFDHWVYSWKLKDDIPRLLEQDEKTIVTIVDIKGGSRKEEKTELISVFVGKSEAELYNKAINSVKKHIELKHKKYVESKIKIK